MAIETVGTRVVIFLNEDDRLGPRGLHEVIVERAREDGMAGATVWRGIEGFGASGRRRTARFSEVATALPLAVEIIDESERIEGFLSVVKRMAPGSLITREAVRMVRSRPVGPAPLDDPAPKPASHR